MIHIVPANRGGTGLEIAAGKIPRESFVIASIAFARERSFGERELPERLAVRLDFPRAREQLEISRVRREDEFPRRVIRRETRLEAQADLQQRRPFTTGRPSGLPRSQPLQALTGET